VWLAVPVHLSRLKHCELASKSLIGGSEAAQTKSPRSERMFRHRKGRAVPPRTSCLFLQRILWAQPHSSRILAFVFIPVFAYSNHLLSCRHCVRWNPRTTRNATSLWNKAPSLLGWPMASDSDLQHPVLQHIRWAVRCGVALPALEAPV
jgi:hypothetical protein